MEAMESCSGSEVIARPTHPDLVDRLGVNRQGLHDTYGGKDQPFWLLRASRDPGLPPGIVNFVQCGTTVQPYRERRRGPFFEAPVEIIPARCLSFEHGAFVCSDYYPLSMECKMALSRSAPRRV
jgi:hypothetical protein